MEDFPIPAETFKRSHVDLMTSRFTYDVSCNINVLTKRADSATGVDYLNDTLCDDAVEDGYLLEDITYELAWTTKEKDETLLTLRVSGSASDWLERRKSDES